MVFEPLLELCSRLKKIYDSLREANQAFLTSDGTVEKLNALLDQREFALAECQDIELELKNFYVDQASETTEPTFALILDNLEKQSGESSSLISDLKKSLAGLVESDRQIEERIKTEKNLTSEELKKVRRGSGLLRGYAPADYMDSCFIDKVK